jgi:hypothetical protein
MYWRFLREELEPSVIEAGKKQNCNVVILRQCAYFRQLKFQFVSLSGKVAPDFEEDISPTYYVCERDVGKYVTQILKKLSNGEPVPPVVYAVSDRMTQAEFASRMQALDSSIQVLTLTLTLTLTLNLTLTLTLIQFANKPASFKKNLSFLKMLKYFKPAFGYAFEINERQFEGATYEGIDMLAQWDVLGLVVSRVRGGEGGS